MTADDPILTRRAQFDRAAALGRKAGYGAIAVAVAAFFVALATDLPTVATTTVIVALAVATATLLPAIIVGYAVRAADREDRDARR